jgi:hypothetical protein
VYHFRLLVAAAAAAAAAPPTIDELSGMGQVATNALIKTYLPQILEIKLNAKVRKRDARGFKYATKYCSQTIFIADDSQLVIHNPPNVLIFPFYLHSLGYAASKHRC